jgi:hypothetical protein
LAHYYYVIATLPFLSYDFLPSVGVESFLALCEEDLSSSAYSRLLSARLDISEQQEEEVPPFLLPWYRFERTLRNELVRTRASQLGWESDMYLRQGEMITGIEDIVREVLAQPTPLQAEEMINRARWRKLEELETGHYFDIERLMIIYLKLQLLERKKLFTEELGQELFGIHYADIREAVTEASSKGNGES